MRRPLWWYMLAGMVQGMVLHAATPWRIADWQWWTLTVCGSVAFGLSLNVLRGPGAK